MKEYTYTNKSYLGIKEGIVPPAPQYLWLNSKDDKLYKFGNSGWEVTPFSDVYRGNEFTVDDILGQITVPRPKLTISRAFLDAAYNGVLIIVRSDRGSNQWVSITVDRINNPNEETAIRFKVQWENIEYLVSCSYNEVLIGAMAVDAIITSHNLADWNENTPGITGYIANRTHYPNIYGTYSPGQRFAISDRESTHNINNYRLLIRGELFKIQEGKIDIQKGDATLLYNCVREENGNVVIWGLYPLTYTGLQADEKITVVSKLGNYKALDEFYLPDTVKDAISTTYNELKTLRDNNELKPGTFYRITDYITTTVQENTSSAGHPFDVIVLALSDNTLSEEAYAIKSARDTDKYFGTSNLSAWKIWYSLDNDTNRFGWADAKNGTGVIYRMIDEWNNDVPYDFKNILYTPDIPFVKVSIKAYGSYFSGVINRNSSYDIKANYKTYYGWDYSITKGPSSSGVVLTNTLSLSLDTVFYTQESLSSTDVVKVEGVYTQVYTFGYNIDDTLSNMSTHNNTILPYATYQEYWVKLLNSIIFGDACYNNTFGNDCYNNTFGDNCRFNTFGNACYNNTFGNDCYNNRFGDNCRFNTFDNSYFDNTFGYSCEYNSIIRETVSNTPVRNFVITNGVGGSSESINEIIIPDNLLYIDYEVKIAKNSSGEIKMYCEADLVE